VRASHCQVRPQARIDPSLDVDSPLVEVRLPGNHTLLLDPSQGWAFTQVLMTTADVLDPTPIA
jgi:hypothetical protein